MIGSEALSVGDGPISMCVGYHAHVKACSLKTRYLKFFLLKDAIFISVH